MMERCAHTQWRTTLDTSRPSSMAAGACWCTEIGAVLYMLASPKALGAEKLGAAANWLWGGCCCCCCWYFCCGGGWWLVGGGAFLLLSSSLSLLSLSESLSLLPLSESLPDLGEGFGGCCGGWVGAWLVLY